MLSTPGRSSSWLRTTVGAVAVSLLGLASPACGECATDRERSAPESSAAPWPLDSGLAKRVPATAESTLFVRRIDEGRRALAFLTSELPADSRGRLPVGWLTGETFGPETFGISPETSVAIFRDSGGFGAVLPLDDPADFRERLEELSDRDLVNLHDDGDGRHLAIPGVSGGIQYRIRSDYLLARFASELDASDPTAFRTFFDLDATDTSRSKWPADPADQRLVDTIVSREETPRAVGLLSPDQWLRQVDTNTRSAAIQSRLSQLAGATALRIDEADGERMVTTDLRIRRVSGEPRVVDSLGTPSGERPPLGGLVERGVLGLLRLSIDPERVYRLLNSTLAARGRQRLEAFWQRVEDELLIDLPGVLLDNLTGHVAVVFYGLEGDQLGGSGFELLRRVLELRATREVVLLPIESRQEVARLLDKLTQLSKGHLSRQRGEHTTQYVWMKDGLQWALILGDRHLLFVDSAAALDKATEFERRGHRLGRDAVDRLTLGPLLRQRNRSGLYLDTATLAPLLRENGATAAAGLIAPFESLVLTTESGDAASRARLRLHLRP